jgi:hypothetical protein
MRFFQKKAVWHELCTTYIESPRTCPRRTAMKFETLMLNSLFVACLVICVTTLGAMLA